MQVEYLFIGHGMDGQKKTDDYPRRKLRVVEVEVHAAGTGSRGKPVKTFEVQKVAHNGALYAVAIARSVTSSEVIELIEKSQLKPIPDELL